jgi:hypothetical protein
MERSFSIKKAEGIVEKYKIKLKGWLLAKI